MLVHPLSPCRHRLTKFSAVHRGDVDEFGTTSSGSHSDHASDRSWLRQDLRTTRGVHGGGPSGRTGDGPRRTLETEPVNVVVVVYLCRGVHLSAPHLILPIPCTKYRRLGSNVALGLQVWAGYGLLRFTCPEDVLRPIIHHIEATNTSDGVARCGCAGTDLL